MFRGVARIIQRLANGAIVAQTPDNTVNGGAERGANAVDWQVTRNAASQVASAANSVVCGGRNNTASGVNSVVAGGDWNVASGPGAVILGGWNNSASGVRSWVPGGERGSTRADVGRGAWSSGMFSITGDAQAGEFVLRRLTTDATAARLTADGNAPSIANTVNLPNNGAYGLKVQVIARDSTTGDVRWWKFECGIKRGASAATTSLVGAVVSVGGGNDAGAAAWTCALTADTTNGGLAVTVTGEAGKTLRWVCRAQSVEVIA